MADLYLTEDGDLAISPTGDLAVTKDAWRDYSQQAYITIMTEPSDFTMYPTMGVNLEALIGMPQSQETGEYGARLIREALERNPRLRTVPVTVKPVPTGYQSIRFDIYITIGSKSDMILSVEQNIGVE